MGHAHQAAHHELEDGAEDRRPPRVSTGIGLGFEWFLELPVPIVLLVLWVAGIVFFGACALLTYMGISALVEMVGGSF
jgi:hypothetical protein